eukprot:3219059-Amphidinium_carterae.1
MTAIVVQNAFEQVKSDVEALEHWSNEKEKSIVAGLRRIFDDMDEDHSGTLTREEFSDVLVDIDFIRKMRSLDIELEELPDVFDILDDGQREVWPRPSPTSVTKRPLISAQSLSCTLAPKKIRTSSFGFRFASGAIELRQKCNLIVN